MRLLKKRPNIQLLAPREVDVGQPFQVRAVLDCPLPLRVDRILVELVGLEVWFSESQYGRHRNEAPFCKAVTTTIAGVDLGPGPHAYEASFEIPARFPGSFSGDRMRIEYVINVQVDIPWWPDARAAFVINVRGHDEPRAAEPHTVYVSDVGGPPPRRPYAELSLGTTDIEPGGQLRGAIALSNVALNEYKGIDLSLVAVEEVPAPLGQLVFHNKVARWHVPVEDPREGQPIQFCLRLPSTPVPGFQTPNLALRWYLVAEVDVAWESNPELWIPVRVRATSEEREDKLQPAPPAVGSERTELVWRGVAKRTGFEYVDGALTRGIGLCQVEVRREHRGIDGVYLVGEIRYPDLGMDLDLEKRGGRIVVTGRDRHQAEFMQERLRAAIAACPPQSAGDRRIVCELADSGSRAAPLEHFARRLWALAEAMESARTEIPPPASMEPLLPEWVHAARAIGGDLQRSSMRIAAVREQMRVGLYTQWKATGEPEYLVVEVRPIEPLASRHHIRWRANGSTLPPRAFLHLVPLCRGSDGMIIDRERLRLFLPPPAYSLRDALVRLDGMVTLAKRLSGRTGPYR